MIINSSPLIIFGKLNKIDLLKEVLNEIIIVRKVYEEVVLEGRKIDAPESFIIEEFIDNGKIRVINLDDKWTDKANFLQKVYINLDRGEAETIALALQKKQKDVLIDERTARKVAKLNGLKPIGSLRVLLMAFKKNLLTEKEIREIIGNMTSEKFRISASLINNFWILFDNFKKDK